MQNEWARRLETARNTYDRIFKTMAWNGIVIKKALKNLLPLPEDIVPEAAESSFEDRRGNRRLNVEREISLSGPGAEEAMLHMINISGGGMYVQTDCPLEEGTVLSINFYGKRYAWFPHTPGKVMRKGHSGMAIQFTH